MADDEMIRELCKQAAAILREALSREARTGPSPHKLDPATMELMAVVWRVRDALAYVGDMPDPYLSMRLTIEQLAGLRETQP